ncbi:MAG: diacylglycerol kinase family lipid kinase [Clostridia bacterium]|nr:diacylglycerol kinase family lipid kinase [Clostridia bacterium]
MRGIFIINPSSGKQNNQVKAIQAAEELLRDGVVAEITIFYTKSKDDAKNRTIQACKENYDFIVAVGGDGTVNEVVAGLYISGSKMPMAIMPCGTSNDFATSVGITPTVMCLYSLIKDFNVVSTDIGRFNDKNYFLNVAAGGILSDVAHNVSVESKTLLGKTAYFTSGLKTIAEKGFQTTRLLFEIDGIKEEIDVYFFIIANSKSVGGFPRICFDAKINDGYMDLCIVKSIDFFSAVPVFTSILDGTHMNNKNVEYRHVRDVKIYPIGDNTVFHLDCDGEYAGVLPMHVEVLQGGIKLLLPTESDKTKKIVAGKIGED